MGVSPPPLGSPQCDNPREGNNSTIPLRRGGPGGTGTVPSFKACVLFILCYNKRNSTEPKKPGSSREFSDEITHSSFKEFMEGFGNPFILFRNCLLEFLNVYHNLRCVAKLYFKQRHYLFFGEFVSLCQVNDFLNVIPDHFYRMLQPHSHFRDICEQCLFCMTLLE